MRVIEVPERNILVLGNGFDLHHNMKTKYSDYIGFMRELKETNISVAKSMFGESSKQESVLQKGCRKLYCDKGYSEMSIEKIWETVENGFVQYFISYGTAVKGWIDFEVLIKNITVDIEEIMNRLDSVSDGEEKYNQGIICTEREKLLANSFHKIFITDAPNKVCWIKGIFANSITGINRKEVRKILRKEFDGLCKSLWLYLKEIEPYYRESKEEIAYSQIEEMNADAVITFNYTDTYKRYGINPGNVVHVHGSLAENNIVLGFHDDNEEELQYVYFKKYMQRILKSTPILEQYNFHMKIEDGEEKKELLYEDLIIHFFGHSLDITDSDMLTYLFNRASEAKIYYYDEDDHEEKIERVIAMLGKQKALQRIYEKSIDFIPIEKA